MFQKDSYDNQSIEQQNSKMAWKHDILSIPAHSLSHFIHTLSIHTLTHTSAFFYLGPKVLAWGLVVTPI